MTQDQTHPTWCVEHKDGWHRSQVVELDTTGTGEQTTTIQMVALADVIGGATPTMLLRRGADRIDLSEQVARDMLDQAMTFLYHDEQVAA
jgi:hypothetical protein